MSDCNDLHVVFLGIAGCLAIAALIVAIVALVKLRSFKNRYVAVTDEGSHNLVEHCAQLQSSLQALRDDLTVTTSALSERLSTVEFELARSFRHHSLLRYDAYGELSGRQSTSVALLTPQGDGVVLSAIANRDSSRLYCREIKDGSSKHQLSPEEEQAVDSALQGGSNANS